MLSIDEIVEKFRVTPGKSVRLKDFDPAWEGDPEIPREKRKEFAQSTLTDDLTSLTVSQELLYAADSWSVLIIFQAMDAAGKDSIVEHVFSGVNPQGCDVSSFKVPSEEELDHDFLWRSVKALPARGRIGVFNRSYYEEVLVVRVHRDELLEKQKLPRGLVTKKIWEERFEDINAFERYLTRNGTVIRKFYLHVSKREQERRLLERLDDPAKNWKFSAQDLVERAQAASWKFPPASGISIVHLPLRVLEPGGSPRHPRSAGRCGALLL